MGKKKKIRDNQPKPFRDARRKGIGWMLMGAGSMLDNTATGLLAFLRSDPHYFEAISEHERKTIFKCVDHITKIARVFRKVGRTMLDGRWYGES